MFPQIPAKRSHQLVNVVPLGIFRLSLLSLGMGLGLGICPREIAAEPVPGFSEILTEQNNLTFDQVKTYIDNHSEASDVDKAYEWLFTRARKNGGEAKALPYANRYLKRSNQKSDLKDIAAEVRLLGLAKTNQWDDALWEWDRQLSRVRLPRPGQNRKMTDLADALTIQAQLAGKPEIAQNVYKQLARTLFLNPVITTHCKNKRAKLDLIGHPAPKLSLEDLDGRAIDLADDQDRWVLLDFWATNCPPCVQAIPAWKNLQKQFQPQRFEMIGISLDEKANTIRAFQKQHNIKWTQALSRSDAHRTRKRYHVDQIPSAILINPAGQVVLIDPQPAHVAEFLESQRKPPAKSSP